MRRKRPANRGPSDDGRGWFRTNDLSRVKRVQDGSEPPPEQGRLFWFAGGLSEFVLGGDPARFVPICGVRAPVPKRSGSTRAREVARQGFRSGACARRC